jgi:hypothetical protein
VSERLETSGRGARCQYLFVATARSHNARLWADHTDMCKGAQRNPANGMRRSLGNSYPRFPAFPGGDSDHPAYLMTDSEVTRLADLDTPPASGFLSESDPDSDADDEDTHGVQNPLPLFSLQEPLHGQRGLALVELETVSTCDRIVRFFLSPKRYLT